MVGLTSSVMLVLALPSVVAHLTTITLTKALQSYSRSRLEEYCADHGKPERAAEVAHLDETTERAAEAIAVVSGLLLAALMGVALDRWHSPPRLELLVLLVLLVGGLGYVLAGVLGKVFAEPIIYSLWPAAFIIRGAAWPLAQGAKGLEYLTERFAGNPQNGPRPASVEVEISTEEGENSEDVEAEIPEATRALLQHAVELSRTSVSEIMIPSSAIVSLPSTVTARAAAETLRRTGRSRIPIFGANRDDIIGILLGKDLWELMVGNKDPDSVIPARVVRPPFSCPRRATPFNSSMSCGETAPRWPSCWTSMAGWPAWSPWKTCSSNWSAPSTTSTTYRHPPTRSRPWEVRVSRLTPRCRSSCSTTASIFAYPPKKTSRPSAAWPFRPWVVCQSRERPFVMTASSSRSWRSTTTQSGAS